MMEKRLTFPLRERGANHLDCSGFHREEPQFFNDCVSLGFSSRKASVSLRENWKQVRLPDFAFASGILLHTLRPKKTSLSETDLLWTKMEY